MEVSCENEATRVIGKLQELKSAKKYNTMISEEVDLFINSLNENIYLLKEQLPNNKRGSWAIESLAADLKKAADYLKEGMENGNLQKFWDARQVRDELMRLRQDLINNCQVKLFVTTLEVVIDGNRKMKNFEPKMVEFSKRWATQPDAATSEIRKLLQPLVVGLKRHDQNLQSFVSMVRGNETKVETSTETQKFLDAVLANLEDLTGETRAQDPADDDRDKYLDPFTRELMSDPVKCTNGHTYDRFSVIQHNHSTQQVPLLIACDDLTLRRELFQKFSHQGVESKFYSNRKAYRDEALQLANKNLSNADALVMLTNVLQWAPNDSECLQKSADIKEQFAAGQEGWQRERGVPAQQFSSQDQQYPGSAFEQFPAQQRNMHSQAPYESQQQFPPPQQMNMHSQGPTPQYNPHPGAYPPNAQPVQQNADMKGMETLVIGIVVLVCCFPFSLCCIPCLFPNACGS